MVVDRNLRLASRVRYLTSQSLQSRQRFCMLSNDLKIIKIRVHNYFWVL